MKRLTPALLTLLMFGVVGLLVAAYVGKQLFAKVEKPVRIEPRLIWVANSDIAAGTLISNTHLGQIPVELEKLERDVLRSERVIVGRVARTNIKAATPIRAGQLYAAGELPPLNVEPGMRAVSLEVGDGVSMVDGLIKPGNFVDVLFTLSGNGGVSNDDALQGGLTMKLLEGVKVLAINRSTTQGRVDRGNNRVTLELSEEQANIVTLADERGALRLTYNPSGKGPAGVALNASDRVTLYEILGLKKKDPEPEPFVTEIYRGSGRQVQRFNQKGRLVDTSGYNNGYGYNGAYGGYNGAYGGRDRYELPNANRNQAPQAPGQNMAPGASQYQPQAPQYQPQAPQAPMMQQQPGFQGQPPQSIPPQAMPPQGMPMMDQAPMMLPPTPTSVQVPEARPVRTPTAALTDSINR